MLTKNEMMAGFVGGGIAATLLFAIAVMPRARPTPAPQPVVVTVAPPSISLANLSEGQKDKALIATTFAEGHAQCGGTMSALDTEAYQAFVKVFSKDDLEDGGRDFLREKRRTNSAYKYCWIVAGAFEKHRPDLEEIYAIARR